MDWSKWIEGDRGSTATYTHFLRFIFSPHTRDLVIIALLSLIVACVVAVLWLSECGASWSCSTDIKLEPAAIGGALLVISWAYQAGNVRLGIVDLFVAEIFTMCKVASGTEFVSELSQWRKNGFTPRYEVLPHQDIMIAFNTNAKDLELLDGDVVKYVTATYVYFKTVIDRLDRVHSRSLVENSNVSKLPEKSESKELLEILLLAFGSFESARYALTILVDDGERRDERVLFALVNELRAFNELWNQFDDDILKARISDRVPAYKKRVFRESSGRFWGVIAAAACR
jgi:hypothetical protein